MSFLAKFFGKPSSSPPVATAELAQRALESEQQKLRTIFADSKTAIAVVKGSDFVYEIANQSYLDLFNNRPLIGRALLEALPELEGQAFPLLMKRAFETGENYTDREARAFLRRTNHGPIEERFFDQSYTRMLDVNGKPYGVFIQARDITDLVLARRQLEETGERLRLAIEVASMATWELHVESGLTNWSKRGAEIFDFDETRDIPDELILSRVHPDDIAFTRQRLAQALDPNGDGSYSVEYRIRRRDGTLRWLSIRGQAFFTEVDGIKKPTLLTGVIIDVTEQVMSESALKEAKERAEMANAAKSQFLANMSHEIRTPLGAIMGFTSLLKDESIGRDQQEGFLSVIDRNSTQLLRIIDDILDLSKVEAGMMLIEAIEFSLPEILTDLASLLGFKAREKGIGFTSKAITPLPKMVSGDPTRLRQILMNVVGNAIKFTDQGHVEVRVCFNEDRLDIEVEDTGRGISKEQAAHLFQPFAQADSSTTRKYGGTGLGLILTRSLAEAMGGHFLLKKSELGSGSTFSVSIRLKTALNTEFVTGLGFDTVPARSVVGFGQLANLNILLVEDSPDNQALISIFLGRAGARTDIASDGMQGFEMALKGKYDLVLMDVQMPVMDGITAIKRLRAQDFKTPVLALTAHAMKEERVRCLEAGFTDFISKPVNRHDLTQMILRYLPPKTT